MVTLSGQRSIGSGPKVEQALPPRVARAVNRPWLEQTGVEFVLARRPLQKSKQDEPERPSGQRPFPVIEFEDGGSMREESAEMAVPIGAAGLFDADREPSIPS
jgi:hypothetical protein